MKVKRISSLIFDNNVVVLMMQLSILSIAKSRKKQEKELKMLFV